MAGLRQTRAWPLALARRRTTTAGGVVVTPVNVPSGTVLDIGDNSYKAQTPNETWSLAVGSNGPTTLSVHELRPGDIYDDGTTARERVELRNQGFLSKTLDNWVSAAFWYDGTFGSGYCLISQYHQPPGSPVIGWTIIGGTLEIYTRGASTHPATSPSSVTRYRMNILPFRGQWVYMVMRVKLGASGSIEFWVNGAPLTGVTATSGIPISYYNDAAAPYEKHGIYRAHHTDTLRVKWGNWECGTADLSDRVAHPLPVPTT